jgi:hypothetical protein
MDYELLLKENQLLREENEKLVKELEETKEHLKKYTAPSYKKTYYENNKAEIKQKTREYRQNHQPTEEQKKKWARTAYLNKKIKLEKEKLEKDKSENINI